MYKHCKTAAAVAALLLGAGAARADDTATVNGITFYGTVDVGLTYDTHGAPSSTIGSVGSAYLIQKMSNRSTFNFAESGMGQSRLGLKGADDLGNGWSGIFKLEAAINPAGGNVTDALKSLTNNNGVAQANQSVGVDSSAAGQAFARAAYVGVSNDTYGTLTLGRQTTLTADAISAYDPLYNSYAFSLIGFSGTTAGSGSTEDTRWDNSIKYLVGYGPFRAGAMMQLGGDITRNDTGAGGDLGFDWQGFSADAVYTHKKDEVSMGSLSAAQVITAQSLGYNPQNSLSATVSDNDSYTFAAKYTWEKFKFFAGYEYIRSKDPSSPLQVGFTDIGSYTGAIVNNTAFAKNRHQQIEWGGVRYQVLPKLEIDGAYYHISQNSYATGANSNCSDNRASNCSGDEHVFSLMADYHFSKRFDTYAGASYSQVINGLAAGYYHNNNIDPTVGVRYTF